MSRYSRCNRAASAQDHRQVYTGGGIIFPSLAYSHASVMEYFNTLPQGVSVLLLMLLSTLRLKVRHNIPNHGSVLGARLGT